MGRKPVDLELKKKTVTLGVQTKHIDAWGGEQNLKEKIMEFIEAGVKP
jgi:hypothetical protein